MSPQAGWRHDHVEAPPRTGFTRCPGCYTRLTLRGETPEAGVYSHRLAGECSAFEAPKVRNPRKTKKELGNEPSNTPKRFNDWAEMADG